MDPTEAFTAADVADWLSAREVAKARPYLDSVSDLTVGTDQISARVDGTASAPYHVSIVLAANGRNFPRRATCTCPVGSYCKHVAATLLKTVEARGRIERVSPATLEWIEALRQLAAGAARPAAKRPTQRLFWMLGYDQFAREFVVCCQKGRVDTDGSPLGRLEPWSNFEQALTRSISFVDDDDVTILRLLLAQNRGRGAYRADLALAGRHGAEIMARLIETGRLHDDGFARRPLGAGAARNARLAWRQDMRGRFVAGADTEPGVTWVLPLDPPWYVDGARGEAGELHFDVPPAVVARILAAPPLNEAEARLAGTVLEQVAPGVAAPAVKPARVVETALTPVLRLDTVRVDSLFALRAYPPNSWGAQLDMARPGFRYGDTVFEAGDKRELVMLASGEPVRIARRPGEEAHWLQHLKTMGFEPIPRHAISVFSSGADPTGSLVLENEAAWPCFMREGLPALRAAGWEILMPEDFRHHFFEVEEWQAEVNESENGWFDLDMGIVVEGRRLPLAPLLAELFRRDPRWLDKQRLARIGKDETIELSTADGLRIRLAAERIRPLALTLIDLFDGLPATGKLRVSRFDAVRLGVLDQAGWRTEGLDAVRRMAERIGGLATVGAVAAPEGFALELRHYQREGLAWLQYLREHELGGILADDMGLGKTAQTLAHLLLEKEAGRLDRPALIVLPTSLIFNWTRETKRFAPGLSVLALQGKERKERFAAIPRHDLVLTTYPLLWRDAESLARHEYSFLILDEAQTVKNAGSQGAAVVRRIAARHRLCLTGTPLENHLGELWSQFDFLLPGFLGDARAFARVWRTPIEKHGNGLRAELLAKRVRPFILRRRKEDVAKELPAKTLIRRDIELAAGQRDLYETVRSAMDKRVREEIAARGFARSQIVLLDALLKLRQVCCDPRLVKSEAARKIKERAKLDHLMAMLPELVEEGRRVLVFSQFTEMLALIEEELAAAALPYALLTGCTRDRENQVRRFQEGEVPIFLISLKAGGVGLNLTAADTVIHYDPWWNPAVENQATDRAHRLGQTKPVFVYKLIVAGSIEEKIVALQEQKAELARGILTADRAGEVKFSEADIRALLAPLPEPA